MGYEIYTEHPESKSRRETDFDGWTFWAAEHAPWSGVGVDAVAALLQLACQSASLTNACTVLNDGGVLTFAEARVLLRSAQHVMTPPMVAVFGAAVHGGYGVRVVFSASPFGPAMTAAAYLASSGSASEA